MRRRSDAWPSRSGRQPTHEPRGQGQGRCSSSRTPGDERAKPTCEDTTDVIHEAITALRFRRPKVAVDVDDLRHECFPLAPHAKMTLALCDDVDVVHHPIDDQSVDGLDDALVMIAIPHDRKPVNGLAVGRHILAHGHVARLIDDDKSTGKLLHWLPHEAFGLCFGAPFGRPVRALRTTRKTRRGYPLRPTRPTTSRPLSDLRPHLAHAWERARCWQRGCSHRRGWS